MSACPSVKTTPRRIVCQVWRVQGVPRHAVVLLLTNLYRKGYIPERWKSYKSCNWVVKGMKWAQTKSALDDILARTTTHRLLVDAWPALSAAERHRPGNHNAARRGVWREWGEDCTGAPRCTNSTPYNSPNAFPCKGKACTSAALCFTLRVTALLA